MRVAHDFPLSPVGAAGRRDAQVKLREHVGEIHHRGGFEHDRIGTDEHVPSHHNNDQSEYIIQKATALLISRELWSHVAEIARPTHRDHDKNHYGQKGLHHG